MASRILALDFPVGEAHSAGYKVMERVQQLSEAVGEGRKGEL